MPNELCKPIKSALVKIYGAKNVSVKNGRGTAWGWVEIGVSMPEVEHKEDHHMANKYAFGDEMYCVTCPRLRNDKRMEVEMHALKALKDAGLEPHTYCSDDGYGQDNDCILVDVNFYKVEKKEDKPEYGKVYALTGGPDEKCISNGNSWADSEVVKEAIVSLI